MVVHAGHKVDHGGHGGHGGAHHPGQDPLHPGAHDPHHHDMHDPHDMHHPDHHGMSHPGHSALHNPAHAAPTQHVHLVGVPPPEEDEDFHMNGKEPTLEELRNELAGADIRLPGKTVKKNPKDLHKMQRISSHVIMNQDKHGKRSIFARILLHPAFENAALVLIVVNAAWIGFDIDWNGTKGSNVPDIVFEVGESMFCAVFLLELLVRIFAYRHKEQFFYDPDMRKWNVFDLVLVTSMVMDTWVLTYLVEVDASNLKMLSTLRLLRLMRMTRILRLIPELGMMVKSMIAAVRSVFSTGVLALGIMYIFAILFTQWVKTYGSQGKCIGAAADVCLQDYFGTIALSFLALTQILVFDDTFEVVRPIFKEQVAMGALLVLYILLVSFTVLNMLIGIICDIVSETTASEREKQLMRRVEEIFLEMDTDDSGTVTREEFQAGNTLDQLESLGIEPQVSKNAFDILDVDRDGQLAADEFIRMIFKCLHPPHSEEILEIEARVDQLADAVGLGRRAIQVLDKEDAIQKRRASLGGDAAQDLTTQMAGRSPWMASVEAAANKAKQKTAAAKAAMAEKAAEEAEYAQRLRSLGKRLGDVLLLAEAGSLTSKQMAEAQGSSAGMLMLENGGSSGRTPQGADAETRLTGKQRPSAGLLTILRPAMRALDARLHALRAECKAAGMRNAGNLAGSQGEDLLPRQSLQPLDELISEVISRIDAASKSLQPASNPPLMPPAALRQREVLALDDPRWKDGGPGMDRSAARRNPRGSDTGMASSSRIQSFPSPPTRTLDSMARSDFPPSNFDTRRRFDGPRNFEPQGFRESYAASDTASSI